MASSSSDKIQPAARVGFGRQIGLFGGIHGAQFAARCPPDVQRNTRIVALCGIPETTAAPHDDGWFFSDFFLFYQMLSSQSEIPSQLWLSCCQPSDLIQKHGQYVHGPANGVAGDRRVVMNADMLPSDEFSAGFRVFPAQDLLERFLATLKAEIREAAKNRQPVTIFLFGHGQEGTYEVYIGCDQTGKWKLDSATLASILREDVNTTIILTSCHSGGWVIHPNANENFTAKPSVNATILTAAIKEGLGYSWPVSQTAGKQAGGSVFATCLLNSITASSDTNGKLVAVRQDDTGADITRSIFRHQAQSCTKSGTSRYISLNATAKFSLVVVLQGQF